MTSHIFYAPHPDDEALGMAGHIARATRTGPYRPMIVYPFDAPCSKRAQRLFRGRMLCPWHQVTHQVTGPLDPCRWLEAYAAGEVLYARLASWGLPEALVATDFPRVVDLVLRGARLLEDGLPEAAHHFPAGPSDVNVAHPGGLSNLAHRACWEAGRVLAAEGRAVTFHRIYVYSLPLEQRAAGNRVERLTADEIVGKRAALAEYRRWDPDHGRLAYGYHSVPELFDAATADPNEYLEIIP